MTDNARPENTRPGPRYDPHAPREPLTASGGAFPPGLFDPVMHRLEPWLPTRAARSWAALFAAVTFVHLGAQLVVPGGEALARVTQWQLMPLLAATLWAATTPARPGAGRPRLVRLAVIALALSWAGDTVPFYVSESASFFVMMGMFLAAQLVYIAAFFPYRSGSALHRRRFLVAGYMVAYAAVLVAAVSVLLPTGREAVPIVVGMAVYGAVLVTMATLATGVHRLAGIGGVLFLVSDGLIGLAQAVPDAVDVLPPGAHGFAVMLTYTAAQLLLAAGVRAR